MKYYLVGIKGSGMASLALLLKQDGHDVVGKDVDDYIYTQDELIKNNINIFNLSDRSYLNGFYVIIGHNFMTYELFNELNENDIEYKEYHEFISMYLKNSYLVSICGSHGKTTLTGMIQQGISNSSCLRGDGVSYRSKDEKYFFLESCEYKNHYHVYNPDFIIITNIDYDHVDYFKTEEDYIKSFDTFAKKCNFGLVDYDSKDKITNNNYFSFGLNDKADFYCLNYSCNESGIKGDLYFKSRYLINFKFDNLYGEPLLKDVIACLAFAYLKGEDLNKVINNLKDFKMVNKRFNVNIIKDHILINDYAHHPSQIKSNFETIKNMYKGYKYVAIFKPDRVSRLEYFKNEFIKFLCLFDYSFLVDSKDNKFKKNLLSMENDIIKYYENEGKIKELINTNEKYVFCFMSSKDLNKVIEEVKKIILRHKKSYFRRNS